MENNSNKGYGKTYYQIIDASNKNFPKIFPFIGMSIGLLIYFSTFMTVFFLITGSILVRSILILILIYQFFFAKRSENYRRFLKFLRPWEIFNSYKLLIEEELKPDHSLFSFHPHGIMGFGVLICGAFNNILYDCVFCGSRALLYLPIGGIIARWMGVCGVNNKNFKELMNKGKNIIFVPGGFEEATLTDYRKDRVFINSRKGFIKYALDYGYKLYPCYTFNENKIYFTVNLFENFRLFLNKLKIPGTIFFSKYLVFPGTNVDLLTVIGKPLVLPKINKPSVEDVEKYHKIYINELVGLYNRYKHICGASEELEIM
jgi:hypothetical protein